MRSVISGRRIAGYSRRRALLSKNGTDVTRIAANAGHIRVLNEKGAAITGKMGLRGISAILELICRRKYNGLRYNLIFAATRKAITD
jgi:hypothetical protein